MNESVSRFLGVTVLILLLVYMGVPPMGLLLVGLIGGFLSVSSGDSNKFLTPLLTIGVTNGILGVIMNNRIGSTPRLGRGSSQEEISSVISGILSSSNDNDPPGNWYEYWELFVVTMMVGGLVGIVVQSNSDSPVYDGSVDGDVTLSHQDLWDDGGSGRDDVDRSDQVFDRNGPFEVLSDSGSVKERGIRRNGVLDGPYSRYDSREEWTTTGYYRLGKKVGWWGYRFPHLGFGGWTLEQRVEYHGSLPSSSSTDVDPNGPPTDTPDLSHSLQSLTDIKNKGLITKEEFESKKKELLDRL